MRVYDWPVPDLRRPDGAAAGGGTPHLHTVSSEGYVVVAGAGEVHTLGADGATRTSLEPGVVAWFTPGVVHRLVDHGGLELVVAMSNAGLPEAGDAVLTFPAEVLADPEAYARAATLPSAEHGEAAVGEAALRRRDLALEGYAEMLAAVERDGPEALAPLHAAAARLVAPRVDAWRGLWAERVEPTVEATHAALATLSTSSGTHLADGAIASTTAAPGPERWGMCGRLRTWDLA
nr:cupin domain-containing protein [Cellulomonas sp. APG4]